MSISRNLMWHASLLAMHCIHVFLWCIKADSPLNTLTYYFFYFDFLDMALALQNVTYPFLSWWLHILVSYSNIDLSILSYASIYFISMWSSYHCISIYESRGPLHYSFLNRRHEKVCGCSNSANAVYRSERRTCERWRKADAVYRSERRTCDRWRK